VLGADSLGRFVLGQITGTQSAVVPVISDVTQEQPQLRGRIDYQRRIALIASGETRGGISPIIPSYGWYAPLSIPTTRPKLPARHQQVAAFWPFPAINIGWFNELSKPQTLKKRGMEARYQLPLALVIPLPGSATFLQGWFNWYSEPVRIKPGLKASYQQAWSGPPRLLPRPNVTATLSALEINTDQALIAIRVFPYNPPASATVSIVEIGDDGSATSVVEV
jgi:hypothetical protein